METQLAHQKCLETYLAGKRCLETYNICEQAFDLAQGMG